MSSTTKKTAATTIEARERATGKPLAQLPLAGPADVAAAVGESAKVQPLWALLRPSDRAHYLARAAQAMIDEFEELTDVVSREQGRPRAEIEVMEVLPAIDALNWLAGEAPGELGDRRVGLPRALHPLKRARVAYDPVGVIAVIGAGSAPLAQPAAQVAAALVAGNAVVLKPSPRASLGGERIVRAFARAGLPEGLLRIVHGGPETGRELARSAAGRVLFTGSREAGREIAAICAARGAGVTLELGGKDAMLVLEDAHVPRAVAGALRAAYAGAGEARGAVERIYVMREVADAFVTGLVAGAQTLRAGDPLEPATQLGPLASPARLARLEELVADATARGAELRCGGPVHVPGLDAPFYAPGVLTGVTHAMRVLREPLDGPLVTVMTVDSVGEAIALANDGDSGLGASVWTADRYRARRIARELRAGMVWLNDHLATPSTPAAPWGGVRGSGVGRSHGAAGLRACVDEKIVTWNPAALPAGDAWWHPYDDTVRRAARGVARLRSARDDDRVTALREDTGALLRVALRALRRNRRP